MFEEQQNGWYQNADSKTIISSGAREAEDRPSEANFKITFVENFCGFDGLG